MPRAPRAVCFLPSRFVAGLLDPVCNAVAAVQLQVTLVLFSCRTRADQQANWLLISCMHAPWALSHPCASLNSCSPWPLPCSTSIQCIVANSSSIPLLFRAAPLVFRAIRQHSTRLVFIRCFGSRHVFGKMPAYLLASVYPAFVTRCYSAGLLLCRDLLRLRRQFKFDIDNHAGSTISDAAQGLLPVFATS